MHETDIPTYEVQPLAGDRWAISCLTCLSHHRHAHSTASSAEVTTVLSAHARKGV